jgi:hypothetical protein
MLQEHARVEDDLGSAVLAVIERAVGYEALEVEHFILAAVNSFEHELVSDDSLKGSPRGYDAKAPVVPADEVEAAIKIPQLRKRILPTMPMCEANISIQTILNATCNDGTRLKSRFNLSANWNNGFHIPKSESVADLNASLAGIAKKQIPAKKTINVCVAASVVISWRTRNTNGTAKKRT